ncbi:hypothetical protein CK203_066810 [Vitis vinifera]|uniref:DUF4283 domain-containing protein n=1 Tax=Vitis vinifera TaxID=29760 RepID=A0A438EVC4_VITVI|nr:hypothetical protein CK203_066810 [Vitis vinifera]
MLQGGKERKGRLAKVWEEEGRKFKVERRENGAGRYILCSVIDVESKRFCLVVPEGKGIPGGWALFAEKLRELGVATQEEVKVKEASRGESKSERVLIENKEESCIEKKAMGGEEVLCGCDQGAGWESKEMLCGFKLEGEN